MIAEAEERAIWKKLGEQRDRDAAAAAERERTMRPWLLKLARWRRETFLGFPRRRMLKDPRRPHAGQAAQ